MKKATAPFEKMIQKSKKPPMKSGNSSKKKILNNTDSLDMSVINEDDGEFEDEAKQGKRKRRKAKMKEKPWGKNPYK